MLEGNLCILFIDIVLGLQKLGLILENKVVLNLPLEKMDSIYDIVSNFATLCWKSHNPPDPNVQYCIKILSE